MDVGIYVTNHLEAGTIPTVAAVSVVSDLFQARTSVFYGECNECDTAEARGSMVCYKTQNKTDHTSSGMISRIYTVAIFCVLVAIEKRI